MIQNSKSSTPVVVAISERHRSVQTDALRHTALHTLLMNITGLISIQASQSFDWARHPQESQRPQARPLPQAFRSIALMPARLVLR